MRLGCGANDYRSRMMKGLMTDGDQDTLRKVIEGIEQL